jgi:hypothetical protein
MLSKGWVWVAQSSRNAQRMTIDDDDDDVFPKKKEGKKTHARNFTTEIDFTIGRTHDIAEGLLAYAWCYRRFRLQFSYTRNGGGRPRVKRKARDVLSRRQIRGKICVAIDVGSRAESS